MATASTAGPVDSVRASDGACVGWRRGEVLREAFEQPGVGGALWRRRGGQLRPYDIVRARSCPKFQK